MDKKAFNLLFKRELRKHTKKIRNVRSAYYPGLIFPMLLIYFFFKDEQRILVPSILAYFLFYSAIFNKYIKSLKVTIVRPIIESLFPDYSYRLDSSINNFEIDSLKLFDTLRNFDAQDEIYGKVGDTSFSLTEVSFKADILRFKGLLLKVKLKTNYKKDFAFGPRGRIIANRRSKVKISSMFLKKHFHAYSDDVETFPAGLLDFLEKVSKWSKKKVFVSISENEIYFFFKHRKDLLEPKLVGSIVSYSDIQTYKKYFSLVDDISNLFK